MELSRIQLLGTSLCMKWMKDRIELLGAHTWMKWMEGKLSCWEHIPMYEVDEGRKSEIELLGAHTYG